MENLVRKFLNGNLKADKGYFYAIKITHEDPYRCFTGLCSANYSRDLHEALIRAQFDNSYDFEPEVDSTKFKVVRNPGYTGDYWDVYANKTFFIKEIRFKEPDIYLYKVKKGDEESHHIPYWDEAEFIDKLPLLEVFKEDMITDFV